MYPEKTVFSELAAPSESLSMSSVNCQITSPGAGNISGSSISVFGASIVHAVNAKNITERILPKSRSRSFFDEKAEKIRNISSAADAAAIR